MTISEDPARSSHRYDANRIPAVARCLWGLIVLLVMGASWGLSLSLARIAAGGGAHPLGITFWQTLIAAAVLFVVLVVRGEMLSRHLTAIRLYAACGLVGATMPGVLFYHSASHLTAGILSISVAMIPTLTFALSACFRLERATLPRILGVVCGAASIVVLVTVGYGSSDADSGLWILVACAAAACYAVWNLIVALSTDARETALMVTCGMYVSATVLMAPVLPATGAFVPLAWPFGTVEWAIMGMGVISAVAYSLFVHMVGLSGPVFASQASYIVTLSGVLWGMVIFGEQPSPRIWLSLALMCLGLVLVSPRRRSTVANRKAP